MSHVRQSRRLGVPARERAFRRGAEAAAVAARTGALIAAAAFVALGARGAAYSAQGECGQPVSTGATSTASDALFVLRVTVELDTCEPCVCDVNGDAKISVADALGVLRIASGVGSTLACPPCDGSDAECPARAQFVLLSGTRVACTTNADCEGLGVCNPLEGRCKTGSELDSGWTGVAHDADPNDFVPARLVLDCEGPAPCGECAITALDPFFRNCRCANDHRTVCFNPLSADEESCGGERCECYFGPPLPLTAGNVPTCLLNRVASIGGVANVDEGSGTIELGLSELVFLGEGLLAPCPYCTNDAVPGDAQRDGTCVGGRNDGEECDAQSANTTFPAPGGSRNSLDCFPDAAQNISGDGLKVDLDLTTGTTTLGYDVPCSSSEELSCPCRVCSGDTTLPCHADDVCSAAGAGTCSGDAGVAPLPNACTTGFCEATAAGEGECAVGPDDSFCDAIARPNGAGLVQCLTNDDCAASAIGVDAGACTIVERRECFPDPLVAQGAPSPVAPLGAAVFCAPATTSEAVNVTVGLPGPARLRYQSVLQLFCTAEATDLYQPGVGGCGGANE